ERLGDHHLVAGMEDRAHAARDQRHGTVVGKLGDRSGLGHLFDSSVGETDSGYGSEDSVVTVMGSASSSTCLSACQASAAHLTRVGNWLTPLNAASLPRSGTSLSPLPAAAPTSIACTCSNNARASATLVCLTARVISD